MKRDLIIVKQKHTYLLLLIEKGVTFLFGYLFQMIILRFVFKNKY
jgi:hypothetical protein